MLGPAVTGAVGVGEGEEQRGGHTDGLLPAAAHAAVLHLAAEQLPDDRVPRGAKAAGKAALGSAESHRSHSSGLLPNPSRFRGISHLSSPKFPSPSGSSALSSVKPRPSKKVLGGQRLSTGFKHGGKLQFWVFPWIPQGVRGKKASRGMGGVSGNQPPSPAGSFPLLSPGQGLTCCQPPGRPGVPPAPASPGAAE